MANITNAANNASKAASTATKATQTAGAVTKTASMPTKTVGTEVATNVSRKPTLKELRQEVNNINSIGKEDYNIDENKEYKPGDRVAPGKVVNKNGEIEDSVTKKTGEAALKVASLFAGGGAGSAASSAGGTAAKEAVGAAAKETVKQTGKQVAAQGAKNVAGAAAKGAKTATKAASNASKNGLMDAAGNLINSNDISRDVMNKAANVIGKATGDVADALDKVGMDKALKATGVEDAADSVNSVFDAFGNLLNGDLGQMFDNLGKSLKSGAKLTAKSLLLLIVISLVSTVFTIIMMFLPIWIVMIPAIHASDFITNAVSKVEEFFSDNAYVSMYGAGLYMNEAVKAVIDEVPDYDSLSNGRKVVVVAGATAIGTNYADGGKPTDPTSTGITGGIDSAGLVEWVFWNVTGSDPGTIDVANLGSNSNFTGISEGDLKPGDIGVNGSDAGIYLGNGYWVYIDKTAGVMRGQYSGFTSFYTYNNIDTIAVAAGGGGNAQNYYDGPRPSGDFVNRLIEWATILHNMNIPYSNAYNYNVAYNLDPNANEFWTIIPAGTGRGGGAVVPPYDPAPGASNDHNLKGLDCGGFVSYVYLLATGGKYTGNLNSHFNGSTPANFKEVSRDQASRGDVIICTNPGHVMLFDHFEGTKAYLYEMSSCRKSEYTINGVMTKYSGGTTIGAGCNGHWVYNNSTCKYFTYVGPEE